MRAILTDPVTGPAAWSGRDLEADLSWITELDARACADLAQAAERAIDGGRPLVSLARADFPLPRLAPLLAGLRDQIETGLGFALLRGLDVDAYAPDVLAAIYWGIGTYLGTAIAQNAKGHMLGHVRDEGVTLDNPLARGYQTRVAQSLHVDRCDVVGLLCRRKARSGGLSRIVSGMRIYNEMLARTPWYLGALYRPFAIDLRGEERPGEPPVYYRPVFSFHDNVLSCGCNYTYIRDGQAKIGEPLTPLEVEALDTFYAIAEEHVLAMDLLPGDLQFVNNYMLLHDRSGYEDFEEPDRKRHMLRLWLSVQNRRPLAANFGTYTFAAAASV